MPLGRQGTYAGIGDVVQARRNGWQLAGYHGNRTVPINRALYRVLGARADGGLVVAPMIDGYATGRPMTLPADYVAAHLTLGYATTVHAAQGLTVDTSHIVTSPATNAEALYVGLSRGKQANTAYVTTLTVPPDAPTGAAQEAVHRSPLATLAGVLEAADPERSALAEATESATEAGSVRTAVELLADASELATAGRTARWLDELVDAGQLSGHERVRLAAEDGAATLTRLLRRVELGVRRRLLQALRQRQVGVLQVRLLRPGGRAG